MAPKRSRSNDDEQMAHFPPPSKDAFGSTSGPSSTPPTPGYQGGASAADPFILFDNEEEGMLQEDAPLITPLAMVPRDKVFTPDFESVHFLTELLENMVKQAYLISEQGWAPFSDFLDSFFNVMNSLERINHSWTDHCAQKVYWFRRTVENLEELRGANLRPEIEKAFQALRSEADAAVVADEELKKRAVAEVQAKHAARVAQAQARLSSFSLREPPFYIK